MFSSWIFAGFEVDSALKSVMPHPLLLAAFAVGEVRHLTFWNLLIVSELLLLQTFVFVHGDSVPSLSRSTALRVEPVSLTCNTFNLPFATLLILVSKVYSLPVQDSIC